MTKPTNNMDKIIKGSECGYSAVMKFKNNLTYKLVGFKGRGFLIISLDNNYYDCLTLHDLKGAKFEITDWLYVGNLFGTPKIEEGMRFKRKNGDNSIIMFKGLNWHELNDRGGDALIREPDLSELTPVFD